MRLLIVGLAPGLRGANRTGRPFTGDYAGDLLYSTLAQFGFCRGRLDAAPPDDGLSLVDCAITNAVRCVPPQNKPAGSGNRQLPALPRRNDRALRRLGGHRHARPHRASIRPCARWAHAAAEAPFWHGGHESASRAKGCFLELSLLALQHQYRPVDEACSKPYLRQIASIIYEMTPAVKARPRQCGQRRRCRPADTLGRCQSGCDNSNGAVFMLPKRVARAKAAASNDLVAATAVAILAGQLAAASAKTYLVNGILSATPIGYGFKNLKTKIPSMRPCSSMVTGSRPAGSASRSPSDIRKRHAARSGARNFTLAGISAGADVVLEVARDVAPEGIRDLLSRHRRKQGRLATGERDSADNFICAKPGPLCTMAPVSRRQHDPPSIPAISTWATTRRSMPGSSRMRGRVRRSEVRFQMSEAGSVEFSRTGAGSQFQFYGF